MFYLVFENYEEKVKVDHGRRTRGDGNQADQSLYVTLSAAANPLRSPLSKTLKCQDILFQKPLV